MTVEIDDRTWNDFIVWADANGIGEDGMREYVNRAFRDRFMTDKYGDLNEKLASAAPKQEKPKKPTNPKTERKTAKKEKEPEAEPETKPLEPTEPEKPSEPEAEEPKPKRKILKSK